MRINARLDEVAERDFQHLKQVTGQSATDIIKHSLALYVKELQEDAQENNQALIQELAGIGAGPVDLSEQHKGYLKESLDEKFPAD